MRLLIILLFVFFTFVCIIFICIISCGVIISYFFSFTLLFFYVLRELALKYEINAIIYLLSKRYIYVIIRAISTEIKQT